MEIFLQLREIGAQQDLRRAHTSRLYHDLARARQGQFAEGHRGAVNALSFDNQEARYLLSAGAGSDISLWDCNSTQPTLLPIQKAAKGTYHKYGISAIHWYPFDNGLLTTSSYDETVKVFDTNAWQEACCFDLGSKVYSHSISKVASHALIITACDNPVMRLCDMRSGSYAQQLRGHAGKVLAVEWSPTQEHIIASAGSDGTIRLWDVRKAQACVALLDMYNSKPAARQAMPKAHADTVNGIAWTADGLSLVSTGHDNKLRVWDIVTGENLLINYGTAINNSHWQTVKPLIVEGPEIDEALLFYPSDEGQLLRYGLFSGQLFHRQFVLNGRVTCAVNRSNQHVELVTGDSAGQLIKWAPHDANAVATEKTGDKSGKQDALGSIVQELTTQPITFN